MVTCICVYVYIYIDKYVQNIYCICIYIYTYSHTSIYCRCSIIYNTQHTHRWYHSLISYCMHIQIWSQGSSHLFQLGLFFSGTAGAWPDALETFRLIQETGGVLTMISKIGFSGGCRTSWHLLSYTDSYSFWLKSCSIWEIPVHGIHRLSIGAGFQLSTVSYRIDNLDCMKLMLLS